MRGSVRATWNRALALARGEDPEAPQSAWKSPRGRARPRPTAPGAGALATALESLLDLSFPNVAIPAEDVPPALALLVGAGSEPNAEALCTLVGRLCHAYPDCGFGDDELQAVLGFLLDSLRTAYSYFSADVLRALAQLLLANGARCEDRHADIVGLVLPFLAAQAVDLDAKFAAVSCLGNLLRSAGTGMRPLLPPVTAALQQSFAQHSRLGSDPDPAIAKIASGTLRGLALAIKHGEAPPDALLVSQLLEAVPRLLGAHTEEEHLTVHALGCVAAISAAAPKAIAAEAWPALLPSVLAVLPRATPAAAEVLASFFGSTPLAQWLVPLRAVSASQNFPSKASQLRTVVEAAHSALAAAVAAETQSQPLIRLLRTVATMAEKVPYSQCHGGEGAALAALVVSTAPLLLSREHAVRVVAASTMQSLLSTSSPLPELQPVVTGVVVDHVLGHCAAPTPVAVRQEALHVLARVARTYPGAFVARWEPLRELLRSALSNPDQALRLQAFKVAEEWLRAAAPMPGGWADLLLPTLGRALQDANHSVRATACGASGCLPASALGALPAANRERLLQLLMELTTDKFPAVRTAACKALGSLFASHELRSRRLWVTAAAALLAAMADDSLMVRVRAVWATGFLLAAPGPAGVDPTPLRPRELRLGQLLPLDTIGALLDRVVLGLRDSDKLAVHALRAAGLAGQWLDCADEEDRVRAEQLVAALLPRVQTGAAKLRWNACHAIALLLRAPNVGAASAPWAPGLFQALLLAVEDTRNFKVRISATKALGAPRSRAAFGLTFVVAWRALLQALAGVDSGEESAADYRYREQLRDALCEALLRLTVLATPEDWQDRHLATFVENRAADVAVWLNAAVGLLERTSVPTVALAPAAAEAETIAAASARELAALVGAGLGAVRRFFEAHSGNISAEAVRALAAVQLPLVAVAAVEARQELPDEF